jgi:hypothetical protein
MESNAKAPDQYELQLQESMRKLQACQVSMGVTSCMSCDKLLNCELRTSYVEDVYKSMNKGKGGGFEF